MYPKRLMPDVLSSDDNELTVAVLSSQPAYLGRSVGLRQQPASYFRRGMLKN